MAFGSQRGRAGAALVVGGSRGLGLAIARDLVRRGFDVGVVARDAAEIARAVEQVSARVQSSSTRVHGFVADVADPDGVRRMWDEATAALGLPDAVFTVAGVIHVGPAEAMTLAHYDEAIDIMLRGPIHVANQAVPAMRARGSGRLGTITSVGGYVSPPHLLPYAAAKFGAVGFSEGLSASLAGTGVTATTVAPGLMRTGSPWRARFLGRPEREYGWFSVAASLPLLTIGVDRAARRIVDGVLRGRPLVLLTPMTWVAIRFRGLFPATTIRMMGVMNRLLPDGGSSAESEGRHLAPRANVLVRALSVLGTRQALRNNQE